MAEDEQKTPLQEAFEQIDEVRAKKQSRPTPLANSLQGLLRPALGTPVRPASPSPTPGAPDLYLWTGPLTLRAGWYRMGAVPSTARRSVRWWRWPAINSPRRSWMTP